MIVDLMVNPHSRDHLSDRGGFAAPTFAVLRIEPVEASVDVVWRLLLGHQKTETIVFREGGPAGAQIVASSVLPASMQNHDQSGRQLQAFRREGKHSEICRIGSKSLLCDKWTANSSPAPKRFDEPLQLG